MLFSLPCLSFRTLATSLGLRFFVTTSNRLTCKKLSYKYPTRAAAPCSKSGNEFFKQWCYDNDTLPYVGGIMGWTVSKTLTPYGRCCSCYLGAGRTALDCCGLLSHMLILRPSFLYSWTAGLHGRGRYYQTLDSRTKCPKPIPALVQKPFQDSTFASMSWVFYKMVRLTLFCRN